MPGLLSQDHSDSTLYLPEKIDLRHRRRGGDQQSERYLVSIQRGDDMNRLEHRVIQDPAADADEWQCLKYLAQGHHVIDVEFDLGRWIPGAMTGARAGRLHPVDQIQQVYKAPEFRVQSLWRGPFTVHATHLGMACARR